MIVYTKFVSIKQTATVIHCHASYGERFLNSFMQRFSLELLFCYSRRLRATPSGDRNMFLFKAKEVLILKVVFI